MSDAFLDSGEIVSTRGRNAEETQRFNARRGRPHQGQAGHRAGQWRLGLGLRNRRRRAAGPQARDGRRHALVRQGLGADDHPARHRQRRAAAHHRALLHAVRQLDPGEGHHSGYRGAAGRAGRTQGQTDTKGEASLRGHLKGDEGKEQTGSQSYVPPDAKNDKALHIADDLLRGMQVNPAFPPNPRRRSRTERGMTRIEKGGCEAALFFFVVIARSEATQAIQCPKRRLDCFASLAMTITAATPFPSPPPPAHAPRRSPAISARRVSCTPWPDCDDRTSGIALRRA